MIRSGEMPASRIGRVWRFDESVVLEWFNKRLAGGNKSGNGTVYPLWNGTTRVAELLSEDTVQYTAERRTKDEVLEALAALAVRTHSVPDYGRLVEQLSEREAMCPTAVDGGIAFPHPRHPMENLRHPVLSMLVARHGVEFGAPDGEPTRIFVLVCSPDDRIHVKILSHLARLFRPAGAVAHMMRCHSSADIVREVSRLESHMIGKDHTPGEEVTP